MKIYPPNKIWPEEERKKFFSHSPVGRTFPSGVIDIRMEYNHPDLRKKIKIQTFYFWARVRRSWSGDGHCKIYEVCWEYSSIDYPSHLRKRVIEWLKTQPTEYRLDKPTELVIESGVVSPRGYNQ